MTHPTDTHDPRSDRSAPTLTGGIPADLDSAAAGVRPNRAFRVRRWFGACSLPITFAVMILGTAMLDPLDDSADEQRTMAQALGHAHQIAALGWAEIGTSLLALAGLLSVVGAIRGRGAGWANATGIFAGVASVGFVGIAMNHFVVSGLTGSSLSMGQKVEAFTRFHHAGGPIIAFIILGGLGFFLAAVAAWRSGLSSPLVVVPAVAFVLLSMTPGVAAEYGAYVAGLVMATWIARDLLRALPADG